MIAISENAGVTLQRGVSRAVSHQ